MFLNPDAEKALPIRLRESMSQSDENILPHCID